MTTVKPKRFHEATTLQLTAVKDAVIYRVQDPDGVGFFNSCLRSLRFNHPEKQDLYEQVYLNHCRIPGIYTDLHCRFQNNNLSIDLNKYYSAYQSIDQVCEMWTEEALEFYRFLGFSLVKIHVKRCIVTDHQCFFRKKDIVRADICIAL